MLSGKVAASTNVDRAATRRTSNATEIIGAVHMIRTEDIEYVSNSGSICSRVIAMVSCLTGIKRTSCSSVLALGDSQANVHSSRMRS